MVALSAISALCLRLGARAQTTPAFDAAFDETVADFVKEPPDVQYDHYKLILAFRLAQLRKDDPEVAKTFQYYWLDSVYENNKPLGWKQFNTYIAVVVRPEYHRDPTKISIGSLLTAVTIIDYKEWKKTHPDETKAPSPSEDDVPLNQFFAAKAADAKRNMSPGDAKQLDAILGRLEDLDRDPQETAQQVWDLRTALYVLQAPYTRDCKQGNAKACDAANAFAPILARVELLHDNANQKLADRSGAGRRHSATARSGSASSVTAVR